MRGSADLHVLSRTLFDAAVFDLDGVITRTARLHARAWQQMFDPFLAERGDPPFDLERDYRAYVDGKPRLAGVRDFLEARGIELLKGAEDDAPGTRTLWSLANRKNALFQELLEREGAEVFESSIELVKSLRAAGFGTAIVSSSRNCAPILESVGARALFDVKVDGIDAAERGLAGKPAPDIFVAAARLLGVAPARAIVFEDALAGVEAGRAGGFGRVIGVDRARQADALRARGAHLVVSDLAELRVEAPARPPSALERLDEIAARLHGRRLALFLDYDGTLTPIVERPEAATLDAKMRASLARIAAHCALAVVSGRDLADVRERVALEGPAYAGSHGFDILVPGGERQALPEAEDAVPALEAAEHALREATGGIDGAQVERKRFSIAVHTRRAREAEAPAIERAVDAALQANAGLRKRHGKKVFELQPDVDWDKGAAVRWLLGALGLDDAGVVPVYIGDDLTDEDAFRAIAGHGIGIVVLDAPRASAAQYALRDPGEVRAFLDSLAGVLERAA